jgi:hypothetical protein
MKSQGKDMFGDNIERTEGKDIEKAPDLPQLFDFVSVLPFTFPVDQLYFPLYSLPYIYLARWLSHITTTSCPFKPEVWSLKCLDTG